MDRKKLVWIFMTVGGFLGGWIPTFWDSSFISMSGIIGSAIGGFLGIYIGFKLSQ